MSRIDELKQISFTIKKDKGVKVSDLFLKDEKGDAYLDYIIKKRISIIDEDLIDYLSNDYNLLKYLMENHYFLPHYNNIDILFTGEDALIICLFKERHKSLTSLMLYKIFSNNKLVLKLINININYFKEIINQINDTEILYKCLSSINRLDLIQYANEYTLLNKTSNNITLFEEFLKSGEQFKVLGNLRDKKIVQMLFDNKRYNDILQIDLKVLLNLPNKNYSYINMLIQKYKEGYNIDFNNINYFSDNKSKALYIICCLKNGILIDLDKFGLTESVSIDYQSVILHILKQDKEIGLKIIKELNLEEDIINDISKILGKNDFENLSVALSCLPNTNELIERIEKGEITKITKKDILAEDLLIPFKGSTILDYALRHNIDLSEFKSFFKNTKDIDIIVTLINNKYEYDNTKASSLLFEDITEDKKLIDLLMEKGYKFYLFNIRAIDYAFKYNKLNYITNDLIEEMLVEKDGNFEIEKYLNNDDFLKLISYRKISEDKLLKLYKKGYKKALMGASEKILLTKINGITILEDMLNSNITPNFNFKEFNSKEIMEILLKYKRYDLMYKGSLELLINEPNKEGNYLSIIINSIKNGIETNFEKTFFNDVIDKELLARCYIQMTKNGLLGYLQRLKEKDLLSVGKDNNDLLYYLILLDKDLTINNILTRELKNNPKIFAKLKLYGVSDLIMDIKYDRFDLSSLYVKVKNQEYLNGVKVSEEKLLGELYQLFINDGISDKELVEALIISYRYNISVNPLIITEIEKLIEIKKAHPEFCYKKENTPGHFDGKSVVMCEPIISIINHETGHTLHFYMTYDKIPDNYVEIINRIINSDGWLNRVSEFSKMFLEIYEKTYEMCEKIVEESIINKNIEEEAMKIIEAIKNNKESLRREYKELGYDEEKIDLIFSQDITVEEFIKNKKEIQRAELLERIIRYDYDTYSAISDIIDAISKGKYFESILKTENDEKIEAMNGHGVRYYSNYINGFREMLAQYSQIIKSKNRIEGLKMLRYYVGEELVDLLEEFYNKKILGIENTISLGGK